jgi:hypothetical protein
MRRTIVEETVLLASVIKWILLASCTGVLVGLAATAFLSLLLLATSASAQYRYFFILLPGALFLSSLLTKYLAPDAEGHGTEKVIEAIHKQASRIPLAVVPVKLLATIITLASFFNVPYLHAPAIPMATINEALLLRVISALLIVGLRLGRKFSDAFRVWPPVRGIIGGGGRHRQLPGDRPSQCVSIPGPGGKEVFVT